MFMAELKNHLLTSGHDLDKVVLPGGIDVAAGDETLVGINGRSQQLKKGDMFIADQGGVLSTIIYGPDQRTSIQPETNRVLFTVYAPPGISATAVQQHMEDIREYVLSVSPDAETEMMMVLGAE